MMMCTDCGLRYKCWTTRNRPRILNGVAWQFSTIAKRSCKACLHSKFRESPSHSDFVKVGVCTEHNILVHNDSVCKKFKKFYWEGSSLKYPHKRFKRRATSDEHRIKNTYLEKMSRNELAIYTKQLNKRTKLPMVCFNGAE